MGGLRLVIAGGPRCGKTTYAKQFDGVRHSDDLITSHDWSSASHEVANWLGEPGPWVIEGVALGRSLRKALARSGDKPCDRVVWMVRPKVELLPGQQSMLKGCLTVWAEICPELLKRGVKIEEV